MLCAYLYNAEQTKMAQQPVTVSTLELGPTSEEDKEEGWAYSTRSTYTDILDFHVVPKWGKKKLLEVRRADSYWTFLDLFQKAQDRLSC
jgi:hypothetical protein